MVVVGSWWLPVGGCQLVVGSAESRRLEMSGASWLWAVGSRRKKLQKGHSLACASCLYGRGKAPLGKPAVAQRRGLGFWADDLSFADDCGDGVAAELVGEVAFVGVVEEDHVGLVALVDHA